MSALEKDTDEKAAEVYEELNYTTILSNGEEVELLNGGRHKKVDASNIHDFVKKTL